MLHGNLREGRKNPGLRNKYTKFGQLIIRKIIKIIATRCHVLMHQIRFLASVRLSLCPLVMEFDTYRSRTVVEYVIHRRMPKSKLKLKTKSVVPYL